MLYEFLEGTAIGLGTALVLLFLLALIMRLAQNRKMEKLKETMKEFPAGDAGFSITRREIADDTRSIGDPNIMVVERPSQPELPMSLKYRGRTYAMLLGTDSGVMMLVRITDEYAVELAQTHFAICRAHFPHGANWYYIPVDSAFKDKGSVYRVLDAARAFVARKNAARHSAARKAAA